MVETPVKQHLRSKNERETRDITFTLKINQGELNLLNEKAEKYGKTKTDIVRQYIEQAIKEKEKPYSLYKCNKCKKRIPKNIDYYTESANIETQSIGENEIEIDINDSEPFLILCMDCARKKRKLNWLKKKSKETTQVKESHRGK